MKKISASEGNYLTQKTIENEAARVFVISLYLADSDSEDNWREATQEEYYKWQQERDSEVEAYFETQEQKEVVG